VGGAVFGGIRPPDFDNHYQAPPPPQFQFDFDNHYYLYLKAINARFVL